MAYPKVLVTGHPNSGTSFLCNLVAEMGFSPGDPAFLKPADGHNPHGYWEHVPLQSYVRKLSGYDDRMHATGEYPPEPLSFGDEERRRVALFAESAGVEVFKETGLPVMYRLFPRDSKYIIIKRNIRPIYRSGGYEGRGITFDAFCQAMAKYEYLYGKMISEMDCCVIRYEDFFSSGLDLGIWRVAKFLGIEIGKANMQCLRAVWRPRRKS